jgi:hypothetical protein
MFDTKEQLDDYIDKIFKSLELFEWDVLHVSTNTDRAEVIKILAKSFVEDTLKNEINFLYVKDVNRIKYSKIKQAIFRDIIAEWISFCDEVLGLSNSEAIESVKKDGRINFINGIVNSYFQKFHRIIFNEMFNTFLQNFNGLPITKNKQITIDKILQSSLNKESGSSVSIYKFSQLYNRVRIAQDAKNKEINKLKARIQDLKDEFNSNKHKNSNKDNELLYDIEDLEDDLEDLKEKGLYQFDAIIARLRENMIDSMRVSSLGV